MKLIDGVSLIYLGGGGGELWLVSVQRTVEMKVAWWKSTWWCY